MDHHSSHPEQRQDLGRYAGQFDPIPTSHQQNVGGEGLVAGLLDPRMLMERDTGDVVMGHPGDNSRSLPGDPHSIHMGGGHQGGMLQLLAGGVSHEDAEGDTHFGGSGSHTVLDYIQHAPQLDQHHPHAAFYQDHPSSNGAAMHEHVLHEQMESQGDLLGMHMEDEGPSSSSKKRGRPPGSRNGFGGDDFGDTPGSDGKPRKKRGRPLGSKNRSREERDGTAVSGEPGTTSGGPSPPATGPLNFNWPNFPMNPMAFSAMGPLGSLITSHGQPIAATPSCSSSLTAAQLQAASAAAVFAPLFSLQQPVNPLHANLPVDLQLRKRGRPPGSGRKQSMGDGMFGSTSGAGASSQGEGTATPSEGPLGHLLMPSSSEGQAFFEGEGEGGPLEEDEDSDFPEDDDMYDHQGGISQQHPLITAEQVEAHREQAAAAAAEAADAFEKELLEKYGEDVLKRYPILREQHNMSAATVGLGLPIDNTAHLTPSGRRRGRPPGSKNRPKTPVNPDGTPMMMEPTQPKKRGRPLGSKNKPRIPASGAGQAALDPNALNFLFPPGLSGANFAQLFGANVPGSEGIVGTSGPSSSTISPADVNPTLASGFNPALAAALAPYATMLSAATNVAAGLQQASSSAEPAKKRVGRPLGSKNRPREDGEDPPKKRRVKGKKSRSEGEEEHPGGHGGLAETGEHQHVAAGEGDEHDYSRLTTGDEPTDDEGGHVPPMSHVDAFAHSLPLDVLPPSSYGLQHYMHMQHMPGMEMHDGQGRSAGHPDLFHTGMVGSHMDVGHGMHDASGMGLQILPIDTSMPLSMGIPDHDGLLS